MMSAIPALTGKETIKMLRALKKKYPEAFDGIKTAGKGRRKADIVHDFAMAIQLYNAQLSESERVSNDYIESINLEEEEQDMKQESESSSTFELSESSSESRSTRPFPGWEVPLLPYEPESAESDEVSEPSTSHKQCTTFYGHCGVDLLWFALMVILIALGIREATLLIQGSKDDNLRISGIAYCVMAVFVVAFNHFF